jgi:hypothetical protein
LVSTGHAIGTGEARDAGADFNFIAVPATFAVRPKEVFDPVYQAETDIYQFNIQWDLSDELQVT